MTFFFNAIIWLSLEAEFLAITLVLVYVGAVMVLFIFVVMKSFQNIVTKAKYGYNLGVHEVLRSVLVW